MQFVTDLVAITQRNARPVYGKGHKQFINLRGEYTQFHEFVMEIICGRTSRKLHVTGRKSDWQRSGGGRLGRTGVERRTVAEEIIVTVMP